MNFSRLVIPAIFKRIFSQTTKLLNPLVISVVAIVLTATIVKAGSLTPSSSPAATSYTLSDIYSRLIDNTEAVEGNHNLTVSTSPSGTMYTLAEIYEAIPTIDATKVLAGTTYLGVDGSIANNGSFSLTPGATNQAVTAGYYSGGTLIGDADLIAGNISSGVNIFGVVGSLTPTSGYTYGDSVQSTVLTTATGAGTYNVSNLSNSVIKLGTTWGVSLGSTGTLTPDGGTASVADLFSGATANLTNDWDLDTGTLSLACNTATFDGSGNLVADTYDGAGSGANRWCMTESGDAAAGDILSGKTAWVDGIAVSGSMSTQTLSAASETVSAGYYGATTLSAVDADLTAGNISSGVNIFGVVGSLSGGATLHSGQTLCHNEAGAEVACAGTGYDADNDGTAKSYTDNGDDTVTDNQTGLIWQKYDQSARSWQNAVTYCNDLTLAGSSDWRLPSIIEGVTMFDYACAAAGGSCYADFQNSALDWTNTGSGGNLWLSTTRSDNTSLAYYLSANFGYVYYTAKTSTYVVRCVR